LRTPSFGLLLNALDLVSDAVLITDADGVVTHANPAARLVWAPNAADIVGTPVADLLAGATTDATETQGVTGSRSSPGAIRKTLHRIGSALQNIH
jgi:PAS domain-containing protein